MASARSYDSRDSRSYGSSLNLQKERERTKKKREQQFDSREKSEPTAVFSEPPRKISTSAQDPLSLSIKNVLGPSQNFERNILSSNDPNIWLGTSRSQNTNTPATPVVPESSEPPLNQHSLKKMYNNNPNHKKSSQHRSSSEYKSSSDRKNNHSSSRDRDRHTKHYSSGSSGSSMRNKLSRATESPHNKSSGYSSNNTSKHDSSSIAMDTTLTASQNHDSSLINDEIMDGAFPSKVSDRLSERSRMSSVDSDYSGVEKIFEIMEVPGPLTAIRTPSANHNDTFHFEKYTKRKYGHDDDVGSISAQDKNASDSESSEESSDDEEEVESNVDKWLLGGSIVPEDNPKEKPPADVKKRESERVKSKQHADKINNVNNHRKNSSSRGRDLLIKHSRSTNHSSTSSHRSESSDRGSVKSHRKSRHSPQPQPATSNRFMQRKSPIKEETSPPPNNTQSKSNPHQFVARKGINNALSHPDASDDESDVLSTYHSDSSSSDSEIDEPKQSWELGSMIEQTNQIKEQQTNKHTVKQYRDHNAIDSSHSKPSGRHGNQSKSPNRPNSSSSREITNSSKSIKSEPQSLTIKFHCYLFNKPEEKTNKFANKIKNERFTEPSTVSHHAKYEERKVSPRHMPTISTGSETDQPLRRANTVQLADADGSKVWPDSTSTSKRKHQHTDTNNEPYNNQSKRRKPEQSPNQNQHHNLSPSSWRCDKKELSPHKRNQRERTPTSQHSSSRHHHSPSPTHNDNNKQFYQTSRTSATPGVAAIVPEPDSSWPEQERLQTADQYMCEGKRLKHEGDGLTDTRTGKTRPGKHHKRALAYFEAALCFIMTGYVMEIENNADRSDTGSSSGSSSTSHSPSNMYLQTIQLLDYVLKMRPTSDQVDLTFKRISASCHRCQSVLYFRIFKLKKDIALKYSELLTEQFKSSKSNRTPSPWHHTTTQPNVLSPMSPAVQSPFGISILPGPSPVGVNNNGSEVSSSTQPGKMTPTHNSVVIPQKTYDIFRQHHSITSNLLKAHEKWDQAEQFSEEHRDFFRNIDTMSSRTLSFHSSLRDVVVYNRVVLHRLTAAVNGSPRDPLT